MESVSAGASRRATAPRLSFSRLSKEYSNGVVACSDISFDIEPGTVQAIIGENGAGKSTLMKMLYGMERPSSGSITIDGEPVALGSSHDAIAHGIGMVHQSFMMVPTFPLAQNIVLGAEPMKHGLLDRRRAVEEVTELSRRFQLTIDPNAKARDVPVGMLQRAEILKALYRGAQILVLDEPTAVLAPQETTELFRALREFAAAGRTVIFISHKLREVMSVADNVAVMRSGRLVGRVAADSTSEGELASLMVGRSVAAQTRSPAKHIGETALRATGLSCLNDLGQPATVDIDFELHRGEIVGIVGVEGNGQTELIETIAGLRDATAGSVTIAGSEVTTLSVRERRELGLRHIPEDRIKNGAALSESIADNLIVDRYTRPPFARHGILDTRAVDENGERLIDRFAIRAADPKVPVGSLSGGNIQKVIVARELDDDAVVLLAAQPTRGVDIGAMEFIYAQMRGARDRGAAVLLVSADLTEALSLSDRLIVLRQGRVVAEFDDVAAVTEEIIGMHMLGAVASPAEGGDHASD